MYKQNKDKPFFSVVIPVYNKEPHIARSIDSILAQTFENFELIIICDPSTDNSNMEVQKFDNKQIQIFYRNEPGPGGYAARNLGIKKAKGNWVAFLDADDEWYPNHLENCFNLIKKFSNCNFLASGYTIIENRLETTNNFYNKYKDNGPLSLSFQEYLEAEIQGFRVAWTSIAVVKRDIFKVSGDFPAGKAKRGGDVDTWLRVVEAAQGIVWSNHLGAIYYRDSVNMVTKSQSFYAQVERDTVKEMIAKYSDSRIIKLLKKFSNKRTLGAWRENLFLNLPSFRLYDKLYYSTLDKKTFLLLLLSFFPRYIFMKIYYFLSKYK